VLKQSTAYTIAFFMVSSSDHLAAKTAAAPVVNISKAGGAFGAAAGAVTEIANGWYKCALTSADTNTLGDLAFHITGTGADDTDFREQVFAKTVDDLMSTFTLPANFSSLSISAAGLVDILQTAADKVWGSATRSLTDKVGYALSAAGVQAIWDALTSALTTGGSIGKLIVDNLNATITSVKALLPAALVGGRMDSSVGAMQAGVITAPAHAVGAIDAAAIASDADNEIADALLDRADAVETGLTPRGLLRLIGAALSGKASGMGTTTAVFRNAVADSKARITATVDVDGNRTAITTDTT
jgi:hypothetical protein